jgi:hypothetical protein
MRISIHLLAELILRVHAKGPFLGPLALSFFLLFFLNTYPLY